VFEIYEYLPDVGAMGIITVEQPPQQFSVVPTPENGMVLSAHLNGRVDQ
jgi:hypothetical protein